MNAIISIESKCIELRANIAEMQSSLRACIVRIQAFEESMPFVRLEESTGYLVKKLDDKIKKERKDMESIQEAITDTETKLAAFEETKKLLSRESDDRQQTDLRPDGSLFKIREAIRKAGAPLTLSEILISLGIPEDPTSRNNVRGTVGRYARENNIFTKTNTNTFGLVELGHKPSTVQEGDET